MVTVGWGWQHCFQELCSPTHVQSLGVVWRGIPDWDEMLTGWTTGWKQIHRLLITPFAFAHNVTVPCLLAAVAPMLHFPSINSKYCYYYHQCYWPLNSFHYNERISYTNLQLLAGPISWQSLCRYVDFNQLQYFVVFKPPANWWCVPHSAFQIPKARLDLT